MPTDDPSLPRDPGPAPDALTALRVAVKRALLCLHIAVESSVADDVNAKVSTWTDALEAALAASASRVRALEEENQSLRDENDQRRRVKLRFPK